ncbi:hypothetical protein [Variovorax gossypii]|uniref:hypothetical protein n=1 Tax=uncultured Variovorax sp. TaxID=114708 RepID=UPI00260AD57A|nr:hypothetical protein [uncultured Variovorax sp.]
MAITKSGGERKNLLYMSLVERTNKHMSAAEIEKNPELKSAGFLYKDENGAQQLARQISGNVISVKAGTDTYAPAGQAPQTYPIATVRLSDGESVKIRLDQNLGRTVMGLLAANALVHHDGPIDIYVSQVRAGERIGDGQPFDKDKSFISVKPMNGATADKIKPIFAGADGNIIMEGEGDAAVPAGLPKAKTVRFQGKDQLDWEEVNQIAVYTAAGLEHHYKAKDARAHSENNAPAGDHEADDIDPSEAAAAAAPRG